MTRPIHLVGMGVQGSLLAWALWGRDLEFTWEDTDVRYRAWEASSGLVYPSGEDEDTYATWMRWASSDDQSPWNNYMATCQGRTIIQPAAFWFASKSPPNGGKSKIVADLGALRCSSLPAFVVNVPELVRFTRKTFHSCRRWGEQRTGPKLRVVTHGYSPRLHHYSWGWTAHAELQLSARLIELSQLLRPCLYLRVGRFQFGYANPLPGDRPRWIAGSAHIVQTQPHPLAMRNKVDKWVEFVERTAGGHASVLNVSPAIQGWRPVGAPDDPAPGLAVLGQDGVVYGPPMGGDGVRRAPKVLNSFLELLEALT